MRSLKINRLLPIYISIVPLKFGVDIQSQTKVSPETKEIQYGRQVDILKVTSLKINKILPIYISIVPLKFEVDIQSQSKLESGNQKNPIWPPGGHFEINIAENQYTPTHKHKYCAT